MAYCYIKKYFTVIVILMLILVKTGYAAAHNDLSRGKAMPDTVSGVVLDEYGKPLKGVKVTVKGKPDAVITNANGQFVINAAVNNALVFNYQNYNVREVTVKNNKGLTIRLIDTYLKSPEKINILYGTANASKNIGAISTIYTNQLTTTPATLYT